MLKQLIARLFWRITFMAMRLSVSGRTSKGVLTVSALSVTFLVVASLLSTASGFLMLSGALRSRTADGLAVTMLVLSLFTAPLWIAYAAVNHNYLQLCTSVLWSVVTAVWWWFWRVDRGQAGWPAAAGMTVWVVAVVLAAFTVVPFAVFGWIAGVVGVVSSVPQMVSLLRADHVGHGFDFRAWLVSGVALVCWTLYGVAAHDLPVAVPDTIALVVSITIIVRAKMLLARASVAFDEQPVEMVEPYSEFEDQLFDGWSDEEAWALLDEQLGDETGELRAIRV